VRLGKHADKKAVDLLAVGRTPTSDGVAPKWRKEVAKSQVNCYLSAHRCDRTVSSVMAGFVRAILARGARDVDAWREAGHDDRES